SGSRAEGAHVELAGVITTPGVAYIARSAPFDAGVVISASHNDYLDNGIKLFSPTGQKLNDAMERKIEHDIARIRQGTAGNGRPGNAVEVQTSIAADNGHAGDAHGGSSSKPSGSPLPVQNAQAEAYATSNQPSNQHGYRDRYIEYLVQEVGGDL